MQDSDTDTTSYKTIVSGNISYNNRENVPWASTGTITDGNGIIIDSDDSTGYKGRTLVSNNVAYGNGGTGMHSVFSSKVDFFNNTAYGNNQTPSLAEGQITAQRGTNIRLENNIMVASPGGYANGSSASGILYDYNLYSGTVRAEGAHDITGNPGFVSAASGNFALQAGSPAIDSGIALAAVTDDIAGNARPSGGAYDLGAYEYEGQATATLESSPPATSPSPVPIPSPTPVSWLVLNVSEDAFQGDAQFTVAVDGEQMGSIYTAAASHAAGQSQAVTISGIPENMTAHDIAVSFINDAYGGTPSTDRNLFIDSAQFDGVNVAGALSLYSNGTVHFPASAPANWLG